MCIDNYNAYPIYINKAIVDQKSIFNKAFSVIFGKFFAKMQANTFHANRRIWCGNSRTWASIFMDLGILLYHSSTIENQEGVLRGLL